VITALAGRAPYRVLCLSGSLRRHSANTALLRAAICLAPASLSLTLYDGLAKLPPFNPDDEIEPLPASVQALRRAIGEADALLIACPEYAHGVPGAFKNLLDWLVGGLEFPDKPVALLNASARESEHAQAALREILLTMSGRLVPSASVTVPLPGVGCEVQVILDDPSQVALVCEALGALSTALDGATGG
jgi:chromate reductase, NAD(P)H dehydrogenase (quinone)